jgi:phenylacetate-CoA ligase
LTTYSRVAAERLAPDQASRLDRLKYTVAQAKQAPFYRERLSGHAIQTLDDLRSLPFTTKAHLKGTPPEAFLAVPRGDVWHYHESFGTTGAPVPGWYTLDDLECEVDVVQRWLRHYGRGKTIVNRYPYAFPVPAQLVEAAARLMGGAIIPTSNLTLNVGYMRVLNLMEKLGAHCLASMPHEAILLKETALLMGKDPSKDWPDFEAFCFAGRILTPSWKATMEEDWACKVWNLYGSTEGGPFATSEEDGVLRLHDDFFLFEVVDPATMEPLVGEDVVGTLVLTTLGRDAQPMIRYNTEDLVHVWRLDDGTRGIEVLGRAGHLLSFGGVEVTHFDLEEQILQWTREYRANVFFTVVTKKGLLVRVEFPEPRAVDVREGARRLTDRLRVPVKIEALPRGHLVNHISLVTSPAVFKPRTVSDHRYDARKVINLSGGLVDWWADFTPRLLWQFVQKSTRDFVAMQRIRFFE